MATKTLSLDEEAYERLKPHKREGESLSEVIKRLAGECAWLEVAGVLSDDDAEELPSERRASDDKVSSSSPAVGAGAEPKTGDAHTS